MKPETEQTQNREILERLQLFIDSKGWSRGEFAKEVGIDRRNVHLYFNGSYDIQRLFIKLLKLGCNINWLISGKLNLFPRCVETTQGSVETTQGSVETTQGSVETTQGSVEIVTPVKKFTPPTIDEVKEFAKSRNLNALNIESFYEYCNDESIFWGQSKKGFVWKSSIYTWNKNAIKDENTKYQKAYSKRDQAPIAERHSAQNYTRPEDIWKVGVELFGRGKQNNQ